MVVRGLATLLTLAAGSFPLANAIALAVLGVEPEDLPKYTGSTFKCADGTLTLPTEAVNDEFCECADGSDEPGTGACAGQDSTLFYCTNEGSTPRRLYASRVGDGVCDCCDGSDEASLAKHRPSARCPNVCAEQGVQERKLAEERAAQLRQAVAKKQEAERNARVDQEKKRAEIAQIDSELPALEAALAAAKVAADAQREKEAAEKAAREAAAALAKNQSVCRWRQTGGCTPDGAREASNDKSCYEEIAAGISGYCDCDGDGTKGESETGFDCSGKAKTCKDLCPNEGGDSPGPEEPVDEEPEDDLDTPQEEEKEEEKQVSEYAKWMDGAEATLNEGEKAKEADSEAQVSEYAKWMDNAESTLSKPDAAQPSDESTGGNKPADAGAAKSAPAAPAEKSAIEIETEAKRAVDDNKRKKTDKQKELDALPETHLGFASLMGQKIAGKFGEFEYKMNFFDRAEQGHTSLGTWKRWTGPTSGIFEGGQSCWEGPQRQLKVEFECGAEEKVLDVFEPSKCVYQATVQHPGACDPAELDPAKLARVVGPKDEL